MTASAGSALAFSAKLGSADRDFLELLTFSIGPWPQITKVGLYPLGV